MIKIELFNKNNGKLTLKISKGKTWTITKEHVETWDRIEVSQT